MYLGIDQHKRQLTVTLRSEDGSVILKRQVSTGWEKVRTFFASSCREDDKHVGRAFQPDTRRQAGKPDLLQAAA